MANPQHSGFSRELQGIGASGLKSEARSGGKELSPLFFFDYNDDVYIPGKSRATED